MRSRAAFTMVELLIVIAIIAVIAAIAIPNLIAARKNANEAAAIGSLKAIASGQQMFREADKDGDGTFEFGNLSQLSSTLVLDPKLGAGLNAGYKFDTGPGSQNAEFLWFAVANPVIPGSTGDRYFCTNHRGEIYYTTGASITPNYTDSSVPGNFQHMR